MPIADSTDLAVLLLLPLPHPAAAADVLLLQQLCGLICLRGVLGCR
jgi:hypothetical protein